MGGREPSGGVWLGVYKDGGSRSGIANTMAGMRP